MRIVHLVIDGEVAGGQMVALQLARAARDTGDEVAFVAPTTGAFVDLARAEGFQVTIVPLRRSFQLGPTARLATVLRRGHADILHTHVLAGMNIAARVAGRVAGARLISHMHAQETFRPNAIGSIVRILDTATARMCEHVIAVSPAIERSLAAQGYPQSKLETIPNGVKLPPADRPSGAALRESLGIAPGHRLVLSVGRLDKAKGQFDLIEAAALVRERGVPLTVVLVGADPHGNAYEALVRQRAAERGLGASILLLGYRDDVPALLDAADVVALPSHSEGISLVLLEAMSHGRPVVATAVGGTPEVANNECAVLVPPRDPAALADAIERVLTDSALAASLGSAARKRIADDFMLVTTTQRMLALYAGGEPPVRLALLTEIPAPYRIPLFNALDRRRDIEPLILFLSDHDPTHPYPFYAGELSVPWRVLRGAARLGSRWTVLNRGVGASLRQFDADVVVVGGWNQPAFWRAAVWARLHRRPLVAWVESTARDRRTATRRLERAKRIFVDLCAAFLVPGRASREYLRSLGIADDRITWAPNAVDEEIFGRMVDDRRADLAGLRERLGLDRTTLLCVARLERDKGVDVLVRAMSRVAADLVLVGQGSIESELRAAAGHNVRFAGALERDELVDWYAAADVFVLPSRSDQWGMVLNEAALAGLPLVASSAAGAAHDLIEPGRNGMIVTPGDEDELVAALESLVSDHGLRVAAGRLSREIVGSFTPDAWAEAVASTAVRLRSGQPSP